jgi:hypothetical protein
VNHYPGWYQDPTGRHQERYFNSDGIPTQFVRNQGSESWDDGPASPVDAPAASQRPVASYRVPAGNEAYWAPQSPPRSAVVPLPIVVRRQRNWWLIGASCFVIALLLSAAILGVIQQRNDADRWQSDYQAEATRYRVAEGKDVAIYAALVLSQEKLAAATTKNNDTPTSDNQTLAIVRREAGSIADELKLCTNDTATVISEIQDSLRAGFIDPSLDSNATDAGAVCREAQSETSSLQVAVSAG